MSSTEVKQVGGNHYGTGYSHWDYCRDANVPYLEGAATKYIFRWKDKNGVEDLKKATSFIDKRLETLDDKSMRPPITSKNICFWEKFRFVQKLKQPELDVMFVITNWQSKIQLVEARKVVQSWIDNEEKAMKSYVNQGGSDEQRSKE